ncbi:MAG TPA: hypothetical protein VFX05_08975 [Casimicrobiaceae bacterium]|nr:hypothetical protein [Casimicrobiaceae bacterium]
MTGSVEFAWARLSARQSRRPAPPDWHRIEALRSLAAVIDATRGGALAAWVAGVDPIAGPHEIEALLRTRWHERVDEVARWMPPAWQPAVAWWAVLPDLPVIAALARGMPLPAPVADAYQDLLHGPPAHDSRWAPLAPAWGGVSTVANAWTAEWRRRLPCEPDAALTALERAVVAHVRAFASTAPGSGTPLRVALAARLDALFRRATAAPAAAFVFLAQCLLDGERIRGELLRRAALPRAALAA